MAYLVEIRHLALLLAHPSAFCITKKCKNIVFLKRKHWERVVLCFVKVSGTTLVRLSQTESVQSCCFPGKHPCHQNISQDNSLLTPLLLKLIQCKSKSKVVGSSKVMWRSNLTSGLSMLFVL